MQTTHLLTILKKDNPQLFEGIAFCNRVVSTDKVHYYMNGIHFNRDQRRLEASDGRRIHIYKLSDDEYTTLTQLPDDENIFNVTVKKDYITFEKQIRGPFPNAQAVIDKQASARVLTDINHQFDKIGTRTNSKPAKTDYEFLLFSLYNAGLFLQTDFVKDLYGVPWRIIGVSTPNDAVEFRGSDFYALIMPRALKTLNNGDKLPTIKLADPDQT